MKRLSLLLMASCALLMSCQDAVQCVDIPRTLNTFKCAGSPPAIPPTQLWVEPVDKSTGVDLSAIRVRLSGSSALNDTRDVDFTRLVKLIDLETKEAIPFNLNIETNVENEDADPWRTTLIYVDVLPQEPLDDAWYALQVSKSAKWEAQGGHTSDDAYIYYRFTTKTQPSLRSIMACQKEQDVKVILDYSEEVLAADGSLEVLTAGSRACERLGGVADGSAEASADFICRGASVEDAVTLKGLNSLVAASDSSITLAGADELTVNLSDQLLNDGCRMVYFPELPQ